MATLTGQQITAAFYSGRNQLIFIDSITVNY